MGEFHMLAERAPTSRIWRWVRWRILRQAQLERTFDYKAKLLVKSLRWNDGTVEITDIQNCEWPDWWPKDQA